MLKLNNVFVILVSDDNSRNVISRPLDLGSRFKG